MKPYIDVDLKNLEQEICEVKFELAQLKYSRDFESTVLSCSRKMSDVSKTLYSIICLQEYMLRHWRENTQQKYK